MTVKNQIEPIRKTLDLNCTIAHAFNVFTDRMTIWWPLKTHSCFGESSKEVIVDKRMGGKIVEYSKSGDTNVWGEVLAWEPPTLFVMTWHPANSDKLATKLTVQFKKLSEAKTQVSILHEGWENRGDQADVVRGQYNFGWASVLELFKAFAEGKKS